MSRLRLLLWFRSLRGSKLTWLLTATALVLVGRCGPVQAAELTVEQIEAAWKRREDRTKAFTIEWVEKHHIPRAARSEMYKRRGMEERHNPNKEVIPPADRFFEVKSSLCVDDLAIRFETGRADWIQRQGQMVVVGYVGVWDKEGKARTLREIGGPSGQTIGGIHQSGRGFEPRERKIIPIFATFRATHQRFRPFPLRDYTLTGRSLVVNGVRSPELEAQQGRVRTRLWVVPTQECVISRYTEAIEGKLRAQIEVTYRHDPKTSLYVPTSWSVVSSSVPDVQETIRAKVTSFETASQLPESTFTLDFPPNTQVIDGGGAGKPSVYTAGSAGDPSRLTLPRWAVVLGVGLSIVFVFAGVRFLRWRRQVKGGRSVC